MNALLVTRQRIWGGGEELLLNVARALTRRGINAVLALPVDAAVRERATGMSVVDYWDKVEADVVIANDFRSLWTRAIRHPKAHKVFLVHGWWQTSRMRNFVAWATGTRMCAVSQEVRGAIIANGWVTPERVCLLRFGPDFNRFRPPTQSERERAKLALGIMPGAFTCVFVGRLQSIKRPILFFDTCRRIGAIALAVVPDSSQIEEEAEVSDAINHATSDDNTYRLSSHLVLQALWAADVFVSTSTFESLGVAIMEAMAVGLPVVTTAVGGPRDFIHSGVNGFIVGDADLEVTLMSLRDNPGVRLRLGNEAIATIACRTIDAVIDEMLA